MDGMVVADFTQEDIYPPQLRSPALELPRTQQKESLHFVSVSSFFSDDPCRNATNSPAPFFCP
jgi:hypothetical protein